MGRRHFFLTIAETTKLLLPRGIPHVEDERSPVGVEEQGVHLHAHSSDVLLLKLTLQPPNAIRIMPSTHYYDSGPTVQVGTKQ